MPCEHGGGTEEINWGIGRGFRKMFQLDLT